MSEKKPSYIKSIISNFTNKFEGDSDTGHIPFPIYIINLERSTDRREFAVSQAKKYGVDPTIIWAVDGKTLDYDQLIQEGVYNREKCKEAFSRQLTLPEVGCTYSHINTYRKIIDDGVDVALILEDDALFLPGFTAKLSSAYNELPENWGVLNLNCPCERFDVVGDYIVKYDGVGALPVSSSAYLISKHGAELYLNEAMPIRYPADSFVGRGLRWGVKSYGVKEPLTSINNVFQSQIQAPAGIVGLLKHWIKYFIAIVLRR